VSGRGDDARGEHPQVGAGPRRLDPLRDVAIFQAALEGLAEHGYDRVSMDGIAARAHVGKGAIYRRWSSKSDLVVDAMVWWREQMVPIVVPDTGSLHGDAEALIAALPDFEETTTSMFSVFLGVAAAASRDPALARAFHDTALERPRQIVRAMLERAAARGEITPDRDLTLVPDIFVGLNLLRLATGQLIDPAYVRGVFDDVVLPLALLPIPDTGSSRQPPHLKR
jgi:AcrR family transcriptional regulator